MLVIRRLVNACQRLYTTSSDNCRRRHKCSKRRGKLKQRQNSVFLREKFRKNVCKRRIKMWPSSVLMTCTMQNFLYCFVDVFSHGVNDDTHAYIFWRFCEGILTVQISILRTLNDFFFSFMLQPYCRFIPFRTMCDVVYFQWLFIGNVIFLIVMYCDVKHLFYLSLHTPARHGHCQLLTRDVWRHSIWNASAR